MRLGCTVFFLLPLLLAANPPVDLPAVREGGGQGEPLAMSTGNVQAKVAALEQKIKETRDKSRGRTRPYERSENATIPLVIWHRDQPWTSWAALRDWVGCSLGHNKARTSFLAKVNSGESWRKFAGPWRKSSNYRLESIRNVGKDMLPCDDTLLGFVDAVVTANAAVEFRAAVTSCRTANKKTATQRPSKQLKAEQKQDGEMLLNTPPRHSQRKSSLAATSTTTFESTTGPNGTPSTAIKTAPQRGLINTVQEGDETVACVGGVAESKATDELMPVFNMATSFTGLGCVDQQRSCRGFPVTRLDSHTNEDIMPGIRELAQSARRQMSLEDSVELDSGRILAGQTRDRSGEVSLELHYVMGSGFEFHGAGCDLSAPPPPPAGTRGRPPAPLSDSCRRIQNQLRVMCKRRTE